MEDIEKREQATPRSSRSSTALAALVSFLVPILILKRLGGLSLVRAEAADLELKGVVRGLNELGELRPHGVLLAETR